MLRKSVAIKYSVFVGVPMLLIGFVAGWLSANLIPVSGDIAAVLGPGLGANAATPQQLRDQFSVFWEVWNLVESEFYHEKPLDQQRMIQGAITGMLSTLDDPYTVYQEPDLATLTNDHLQGTSGGIGIYIRITDGKAFVDKPLKDSPAMRAGLRQDDEIAKVDDQDIAGLIANLDVNEATVKIAAKIRGPKGTTVRLTIRRAGQQPFDVTIQREEITVSSVNSQMLNNGIAYIQITDFKATTTHDFDDAMRAFLSQQPKGMILDLRNNPGGYLTNAQEVLGRFYEGVALYEQDRDGTLHALNTIDGPKDLHAFNIPLVVLINGNSASASEIVAGALRDERKMTYLIGEKTFGKGSVQNIHSLSNGGSARITIAHWLTPHKNAINKVGITPQYILPYNEDPNNSVPCVANRQPAAGQTTCADNQLASALQLLTTAAK